jgi:hypothetical protein
LSLQHHTHQDRTYEQWLADCSAWWDMTHGEEAHDYPWLEWRQWYEQGLTVEAAVRLAHKSIFG